MGRRPSHDNTGNPKREKKTGKRHRIGKSALVRRKWTCIFGTTGRPRAAFGEALDGMVRGLGYAACTFLPDVDVSGSESHPLLTVESSSDHRQHAREDGVEQDVCITSVANANVAVCGLLHGEKGGAGMTGWRGGAGRGDWGYKESGQIRRGVL